MEDNILKIIIDDMTGWHAYVYIERESIDWHELNRVGKSRGL